MRKNSWLKKGLAIGLSTAFVLSLAGWGGSGEISGSSGDKTIRVGSWDNNQLAVLQQIADEWGEENGYDV